MNKIIFAVFLTVLITLFASCAPVSNSPATAKPTIPGSTQSSAPSDFRISSPGIVDGVIDAAYGINGAAVKNKIPTLSLPLEISGAPEGTACYALYMDDPDSVPLCGYAWVHWMAVNFTKTSLPEGFSAGSDILQGKNDTGTVGYAGPTPPDKDHTYRITVYALDMPLDLQSGFSKAQFATAIEGHVLAKAETEGIYKK